MLAGFIAAEIIPSNSAVDTILNQALNSDIENIEYVSADAGSQNITNFGTYTYGDLSPSNILWHGNGDTGEDRYTFTFSYEMNAALYNGRARLSISYYVGSRGENDEMRYRVIATGIPYSNAYENTWRPLAADMGEFNQVCSNVIPTTNLGTYSIEFWCMSDDHGTLTSIDSGLFNLSVSIVEVGVTTSNTVFSNDVANNSDLGTVAFSGSNSLSSIGANTTYTATPNAGAYVEFTGSTYFNRTYSTLSGYYHNSGTAWATFEHIQGSAIFLETHFKSNHVIVNYYGCGSNASEFTAVTHDYANGGTTGEASTGYYLRYYARTGYTFMGWSKTNGSATVDYAASISNNVVVPAPTDAVNTIATPGVGRPAAALNLYAVWKLDDITCASFGFSGGVEGALSASPVEAYTSPYTIGGSSGISGTYSMSYGNSLTMTQQEPAHIAPSGELTYAYTWKIADGAVLSSTNSATVNYTDLTAGNSYSYQCTLIVTGTNCAGGTSASYTSATQTVTITKLKVTTYISGATGQTDVANDTYLNYATYDGLSKVMPAVYLNAYPAGGIGNAAGYTTALSSAGITMINNMTEFMPTGTGTAKAFSEFKDAGKYTLYCSQVSDAVNFEIDASATRNFYIVVDQYTLSLDNESSFPFLATRTKEYDGTDEARTAVFGSNVTTINVSGIAGETVVLNIASALFNNVNANNGTEINGTATPVSFSYLLGADSGTYKNTNYKIGSSAITEISNVCITKRTLGASFEYSKEGNPAKIGDFSGLIYDGLLMTIYITPTNVALADEGLVSLSLSCNDSTLDNTANSFINAGKYTFNSRSGYGTVTVALDVSVLANGSSSSVNYDLAYDNAGYIEGNTEGTLFAFTITPAELQFTLSNFDGHVYNGQLREGYNGITATSTLIGVKERDSIIASPIGINIIYAGTTLGGASVSGLSAVVDAGTYTASVETDGITGDTSRRGNYYIQARYESAPFSVAPYTIQNANFYFSGIDAAQVKYDENVISNYFHSLPNNPVYPEGANVYPYIFAEDGANKVKHTIFAKTVNPFDALDVILLNVTYAVRAYDPENALMVETAINGGNDNASLEGGLPVNAGWYTATVTAFTNGIYNDNFKLNEGALNQHIWIEQASLGTSDSYQMTAYKLVDFNGVQVSGSDYTHATSKKWEGVLGYEAYANVNFDTEYEFYTPGATVEGQYYLAELDSEYISANNVQTTTSGFSIDYNDYYHVLRMPSCPSKLEIVGYESCVKYLASTTENGYSTVYLKTTDSNYKNINDTNSITKSFVINKKRYVLSTDYYLPAAGALGITKKTYDGNPISVYLKNDTLTPSNITVFPVANVSITYRLIKDGIAVDGNTATKAGTYTIQVIFTNTNPNYSGILYNGEPLDCLSTTLQIDKAQYAFDVTFNNGTYVYDGMEKSIAIEGTLPAGVSVNYTNNMGTNAGEYEAAAKFEFDRENYEAIEDIKAILTINKRPVTVSFSGFENLVQNDEVKKITATLNGVLPGEDAEFEISYGEGVTPKLAGTYTAEVIIKNNNYELEGNKTQAFQIYLSSLSAEIINSSDTLNGETVSVYEKTIGDMFKMNIGGVYELNTNTELIRGNFFEIKLDSSLTNLEGITVIAICEYDDGRATTYTKANNISINENKISFEAALDTSADRIRFAVVCYDTLKTDYTNLYVFLVFAAILIVMIIVFMIFKTKRLNTFVENNAFINNIRQERKDKKLLK